MRDRRSIRGYVLGIATAFVLTGSGAAIAAPTVGYDLTGTSIGIGDVELQSTTIIQRYVSTSDNTSRDITAPGLFDVQSTEPFSDASILPPDFTPLQYADLRTFGYFGLRNAYDVNGDLTGQQLFIAAQPGAIDGQSFNTVFADFLSAHPSVTGLADLIALVSEGPDFPTAGANQALIDFIADVEQDPTRFGGNVATTFQTGQTLTLEVFDNTTGLAAPTGGTVMESASQLPEPATLAAAVPAALLLRRRRR